MTRKENTGAPVKGRFEDAIGNRVEPACEEIGPGLWQHYWVGAKFGRMKHPCILVYGDDRGEAFDAVIEGRELAFEVE